MWVSEQILFILAKMLYRTEIAHSTEMKNSLKCIDAYDTYRSKNEFNRIVKAAKSYGVEICGKSLIDLGCNDGAISVGYLDEGVSNVTGVDIDGSAIKRAQKLHTKPGLTFVISTLKKIPLEDECADVIISSDVFEHISHPVTILKELYRILKPGGQILIGTWGWYHPFAPHLWSTMPVPWAHVLFSEKTILHVCRRVYHSNWYVPNMHDFDSSGNRLPDKYTHEKISTDYLNKFLIRDFEKAFEESGFTYNTNLIPFGSRYARFTHFFLSNSWLREFFTSFVWFVLTKPSNV